MIVATMKKKEWNEKYSDKILDIWHKWQSPIWDDRQHRKLLEAQLDVYFDDTSKRTLIEMTY